MTNQQRDSRVARNAIASWTQFAFIATVSFFLSPFVVKHLGATQFGVWSLLVGLVGYLGLLDFGIRQAVSRYVAHHRAIDGTEECSSLISAATRLFGLLGIAAIVLAGVVALLAPGLFNIPAGLSDDARIIILVGGISVAISLLTGAFGGTLTGLERFDVACGLEILVTGFRAIATVIALSNGYGLFALVTIQLLASVLNCAAYWSAVRKLFPDLHLRLRGSWWPQAKSLLSFGASLSVVSLFNRLISYSDPMIIAAMLPIEAVTFFAIAGSLGQYAKDVIWSLSNVMTPRVSALTSMGSDKVGVEIVAVAGIATLVAAPIAATFLLRGDSFITLWMGPSYGQVSGEVLRILSIVVLLESSRSIVINTLTGIGQQRTLIPGIAIEAACKLALSILLIHPFGLAGAALGTMIPSVLMNLGYFPYRLSKATGVPVSLFYRNALLLPAVACLPFALANAVMEQYFPAKSLSAFFLEVALAFPLVPITAWSFCLTDAKRIQVRSHIRQMVGR